MKLTVMTFGLIIARLSCVAQSPPTNTTDNSRFLICSEGNPVCKIHVSGLAPADHASEEARKNLQSVGRRLQKYFYLLSGCSLPIENVDGTPADSRIAYTIHMTAYPPSGGERSARIELYRELRTYATPVLYIDDAEFGRAMRMGPNGTSTKIELPRIFLNQALDAFGWKCFGVPVSAIDDTNFNWSLHRTNTLAISYADFQPIQFPPLNPKNVTGSK